MCLTWKKAFPFIQQLKHKDTNHKGEVLIGVFCFMCYVLFLIVFLVFKIFTSFYILRSLFQVTCCSAGTTS